jgi:BolA protein
MGPIQTRIIEKIEQSIPTDFLEVINESDSHNVPSGSESHFKITLVSSDFEGKNLLSRHRQVNAILKAELADDIHALALHTYEPEEWKQRNATAPQSPPCLGGDKS